MNSEEMFVSPEIAKEWLARPGRRRPLGKLTVNRYADLMRRGQWALTPDAIAFNEAGELVNGQHRLHAVIESDTPQLFQVAYGLSEDAVAAMDTGRRRQLSDALIIKGVLHGADAGREASALRHLLLLRWTWSGRIKSWNDPRSMPSVEDVVRLAGEVDLTWALNAARSAERAIRISSAVLSALLHEFDELAPEDARRFAEMLTTGEDLRVGNPISRLRNQVLQRAFSSRAVDRQWLAAVIIKAWNFWRAGDHNLKVLAWKTTEAFPVPGAKLKWDARKALVERNQ